MTSRFPAGCFRASSPKWGYEVVSVGGWQRRLGTSQGSDAPRMALLDWMMPGLNGVDVCRELRRHRPEPYTYILSAHRQGRQGERRGGPGIRSRRLPDQAVSSQELKARIRVGLRLLELEDSLVQAREAMRFKATHDTLTGVWNRGAILETLDREITRARSAKAFRLGVLIADSITSNRSTTTTDTSWAIACFGK